MFKIPCMKQLLAASKLLVESYEVKRTEFDNQRMFASFRPATINEERVNDANFIKNLAEHIYQTKNSYSELDVDFKDSDYSKEIAPFLKSVITGAMLLELMSITQTYSFEFSVKNRSALSNLILDIFKIDKLSDVPKDRLETCLNDLAKYLQVVSDIEFHPSKSREALLNEIGEQCEAHNLDYNKQVICDMI